jgi:muramoyltetrapeptide carboxypeptidase
MNRKKFISSLATAGLFQQLLAQQATSLEINLPDDDGSSMKLPPSLKKGDAIGVTCPAGYLTMEDFEPARKKMEAWGFVVKPGTTVGTRSNTFAATDEERAKDLQQMLDDRNIKAIMCGRGGYGVGRIIDRLNFKKFQQSPKWLIGFSDITLLHTHINSRFGIASIHSKMCNSFLKDESKGELLQLDSLNAIEHCLKGKPMQYSATPHPKNRPGVAEAAVVGGNLSIIHTAMGTPSELYTRGKILFLEEVGEYLYSLDRMLWNLRRSGKLAVLKGLVIGGFNKIKADDPGEEFGQTIYDIVTEVVKDYQYPVCFDFPVGHQKTNYPVKCGVRHRLSVTKNGASLTESVIFKIK